MPYDVEILGGQSVTDYFSHGTASEDALRQLKELKALKPAKINFLGSSLQTDARNSVMVMVSIVGQRKWDPIWQRLSRVFSMAVFVTGTAFFASAALLSLIMAVVVLSLTLAAGIFGRAIASWIVSHVASTEPMIHIISNTEEEAYQAIAEILSLKSTQVEINGHILINERRVATRSWIKVAMLGVLAEPYDIMKHYRKNSISLKPFLSPAKTTSRDEVSSPFLATDSGPSLPFHQTDKNAVTSITQQSARTALSRSSTDDRSLQIPRRVVSC